MLESLLMILNHLLHFQAQILQPLIPDTLFSFLIWFSAAMKDLDSDVQQNKLSLITVISVHSQSKQISISIFWD